MAACCQRGETDGLVWGGVLTGCGWPLTLKFDRATGLFLKFDMRRGGYRHEKKYYRHDIGHSLNLTCDIRPFKIDMDILKLVTGDIAIS